jgi:microcystin-dependent protein
MSNPFVGEIRMFGGNFAPVNWAFCNGQLVPISQNDTLFALIGTIYGGDGINTFGLPNLQGRVPMHQGSSGLGTHVMGEVSGSESVTITTNTYPAHTHSFAVSSAPGALPAPGNNVLAASPTMAAFTNQAPNVSLNSAALTPSGNSQPHDNMQPFLCINFIISLYGIFPSQN